MRSLGSLKSTEVFKVRRGDLIKFMLWKAHSGFRMKKDRRGNWGKGNHLEATAIIRRLKVFSDEGIAVGIREVGRVKTD